MTEYLWPESRSFEALEALAFENGLIAGRQPSRRIVDDESLPAAAAILDLEAQLVEILYSDLDRQLAKMGPALVRAGAGFLAICPGGKLLAPDGKKHANSAATIRAALCAEQEAAVAGPIDDLLRQAQIPASKQVKAREAILRRRLNTTRIGGIWLLRLPPGSNFWLQLRHAGIPQRLATLTAAHAIQYLLWILTWWIVGKNVLSGSADPRWLLTWAMLLLALVPFRVAITWLQGRIAIGAGALLKRRLFFGALSLDPDSIRHQGAGQLLGRVIESEAVEALALSGGFLGLVALIELILAIVVLGAGAAGLLHSLILLAWIGIAALIGWRYFNRNRAWTDVRLGITHDLVESMVGHRTRLAQLPPDRWHEGEDEALRRYLQASKPMDNATTALLALVPRGWLVLGLAGLVPNYIHGASSTAKIAIAIGGILLAYRALKRLASGAWQLAGAAVAWQRVSVLYQAATRPEVRGSLDIPMPADSDPVVDAHGLVYRYHDRATPVLRGCNLQVSTGERLVLEGPSGGGKSTLVSLLAGLREPNSGRLLLDGLDRQTLGLERWIQRIAAAPQFHENHVLAETFAFNLLMGRHRMPTPADFEEAEAICHELGLGELLERMPAGMLQMVGETGWQLSHGERSRLYIARALLQNAKVVILDESFAALDPENLRRCVECVVRRARSLVVIAHR
ncbi:MAG TPA: ABC transporter ATP-binding protein [Bryobacteraceae bacterium]|nr:ABC transporter ATP-binding protein [Bryobacteraceae bacterium]